MTQHEYDEVTRLYAEYNERMAEADKAYAEYQRQAAATNEKFAAYQEKGRSRACSSSGLASSGR